MKSAVIQNFTFGTYNTMEEAKPMIHGFVIPLVILFVMTSLSAAISYSVAAYFLTRQKRGKIAAREVALFGAIIPFVASGFAILGTIAKIVS